VAQITQLRITVISSNLITNNICVLNQFITQHCPDLGKLQAVMHVLFSYKLQITLNRWFKLLNYK